MLAGLSRRRAAAGLFRSGIWRTRWSATIPTRGHPTPVWRRDGLATRVLELEQTRLGVGVRRVCRPPVRADQFGSRSLDPTTRGLGLGAGTLAMISAEGIVRKTACWIGGVRRRGCDVLPGWGNRIECRHDRELAIPVGIGIEASGVVSGIVMSNGTKPVRDGGGLSSSPMMRSDAAWVPTVMANSSAAAPATTTLNASFEGP